MPALSLDALPGALQRALTPLYVIHGEEQLLALEAADAIRQAARVDAAKDWSDVTALVRAHKLTLDDPEFSAIVRKHGGEEAIERIQTGDAGGS